MNISPPQVKWLLEEDTFKEGLEPLENAIVEAGYSLTKAKYVPFSSGEHYDFGGISDDDCVISYCSLNFAKYIQKNKPWSPGVFCNLEGFRCLNYMREIPLAYLLNSNYTVLPLSEAIRRKEILFNTFGQNNEVFARPDRGDKPFSGMLISKEEFDNPVHWNLRYHNDPHILVLIATPKTILNEWRCFVNKQGIILCGQYKKNDEPQEILPLSAFDLVNEVIRLNKNPPDPIYVIDVAINDQGNPFVVELNSASCSGLYNADPYAFVKVMSEAALSEHKKYNENILKDSDDKLPC